MPPPNNPNPNMQTYGSLYMNSNRGEPASQTMHPHVGYQALINNESSLLSSGQQRMPNHAVPGGQNMQVAAAGGFYQANIRSHSARSGKMMNVQRIDPKTKTSYSPISNSSQYAYNNMQRPSGSSLDSRSLNAHQRDFSPNKKNSGGDSSNQVTNINNNANVANNENGENAFPSHSNNS